MMKIRKAKVIDENVIIDIYAKARMFMKEYGNPNQWNHGYPSQQRIRQDCMEQKLYVCENDNEIVAVFYFAMEEEVTYRVIHDGNWLNQRPYGVLHRIASLSKGKGYASYCIRWALEKSHNLRIDTHRDNIPMQHLLQKLGFTYCGIIDLEDGSERLAYQKAMEK